METFIFILSMFAIILFIVSNDTKKELSDSVSEASEICETFVKKEFLLSEEEVVLYGKIKKICDKENLAILPKLAMNNLFDVKNKKSSELDTLREYNIDFVVVNIKNAKTVCGIILNKKKRKSKTKETFEESVFHILEIPILTIYLEEDLNSNIKEIKKFIENSKDL